MKKLFIGIALLLFLLNGCSSSGTGADATLYVTDIQYDTNATAGSQMQVNVTVDSSTKVNNAAVAVSAIPQNSEDDSIIINETSIETLQSGSSNYALTILVPQDIEEGNYTLIVNVDSADISSDWNDTDHFIEGTTILHISKPKEDAVSFSLTDDNSDDDEGTEKSIQKTISPSSMPSTAMGTLPAVTIDYSDENVSIGFNAILHPILREAEEIDISISACIQIEDTCVALPLWSAEGNGTLTNSLNILGVEQGHDTLIAIDAIVMSTQVSEMTDIFLSQFLSNPLANPLTNTELKVTLGYGGIQKEYTFGLAFQPSGDLLYSLIPVIPPIPALSSQEKFHESSAQKTCSRPKVLHYKKTYEKYKYGKRFGAGVYVRGDAKLDSSGLHSTVRSSIRAKVLGRKDRLMSLDFEANAEPGSFERTGYDLTLDVLKITVYSRSNSLAEAANLSTPEVTEEEEAEINLKISNHETNLSKATLMKQRVYKKANKQVRTYSGSGTTNVGYAKTWDIGKKHGYTQQLVVGIVPITITAGAQATVGFEANIALTGITSLEATFTPNAKIGAYASGGVGTRSISAGVRADLWLVQESLENQAIASLVFEEDDSHTYITQLNGTLQEKITNNYRGPNGKLYLYAEYPVPKYCRSFGHRYFCGYKTKYRKRYLGKWHTSRSKRTLLRKKQHLFSIKLNDCN
jgi:hypothetical protein